MYYLSQEKLAELDTILPQLSKYYQHAQPFPHIVLDDVLNPLMLMNALTFFPEPSNAQWWKYDNVLERKLAKDDLSDIHSSLRYLIYELMEKRFCRLLERLTGIPGLIVDQTLNGGGLHQIVRGGKLDIHADYNYHPINRLDRRLNVLLYLNQDWKPEWKGQLELWDKDVTQCVKSIDPIFNRMVIFSTTDTSWHGHPDPLECPEGVSRKSIALYYYSNGRPMHETSEPHSTIFKRRPWDPIDQETEELRAKRAIRRLS